MGLCDCWRAGDGESSRRPGALKRQRRSGGDAAGGARDRRSVPTRDVRLDARRAGSDVVLVQGGRRACGTGAVLASAPIVQDKAYWEVKVQAPGVWGVGVAAAGVPLSTTTFEGEPGAWLLRQDGHWLCAGEARPPSGDAAPLAEGDVIGISYDHVELTFYRNGQPYGQPVLGCRGRLFPMVYTGEGAILDVAFDVFSARPARAETFGPIMIEQSII